MEDVLKILEKDARTDAKKIADMTGMSESEVKKMIKDLEKKGVIRKYKTVIDREKVGEESVYALIDVNVTPVREKGYNSVAERIMKFPEVKSLYLISGQYDLSVLVQGDSMKEVATFVSEKLAPLDRVHGTTTHFVLKRYKEDGDVLFEKKDKNKRQAVSA
ncbi:Lrp/AsnC family transcriptional regulator [archaeon]|nr:Lrp/AsnC family transcriptional regulator [archaeon]